MTIHPPSDEELLAQRGAEIVRAAVHGVSAPLALRERLEHDRATARPSRRRHAWLAGSLAATMAVVALLVLLVTPTSTPAGPTVVDAALVGMQPATGPAPARDPSAGEHIKAHEGQVRFPYWEDDIAWRSSGVRTATLAGHHLTTVFYDSPTGTRVAYTVVAMPALRVPHGRPIGRRFVVVHHRGTTLVTWREHGQTCILSARSSDASAKKLVWLARHDADV